MPAVKSAEVLEKAFYEVAAKVKSDIEADGVSVVTVMATPGRPPNRQIAFTPFTEGLEELPSAKALLGAAQEWNEALGEFHGLEVIVIVTKGSRRSTIIETKEVGR